MDVTELFPSLTHCIETMAKEEFWNSVNQYMTSGCKDKRLEGRIEVLKSFLESMDFKKLRNQSASYLAEGKQIKFIISWQEGQPSYEILIIEESEV